MNVENEETLFGATPSGKDRAADGTADRDAGDDRRDTPPDDDRGIECPKCGCRHFEVYSTRRTRQGTIIRRRDCRHCGRRVTTTERIISGA